MLLDIKTLSFMLMLTSVLYAVTIAFFAIQANQYKGIKLYMIGAICAAVAFLLGAILAKTPTNNFVRFNGGVFLVLACYFYFLGIARFLDLTFSTKKSQYFLYLSIISLAYLAFFNAENIYLMGAIAPVYCCIFYSISCYLLWQNRHRSFSISIYFIFISLIITIIVFIIRCYFTLTYKIESSVADNTLNKIIIISVFISGYLRNIGFIMMVSQRLYQDLRFAALHDFLTQLFNRRATQEKLNEQFNQFKRYLQPCTIILLDIDFFKSINDKHGHEKGDKVLQKAANILKTNLRKTDTLGRWGGEEFLIILPNTDIKEALIVAEKLRQEIANDKTSDLDYTIISVGITKLEKTDTNIEQIVKRADEALYLAKNKGRNRVETYF